MSNVAAHELRPGDRIWLSPAHAGVSCTVEAAEPHRDDPEDMAIRFNAEGSLLGSRFRCGRLDTFDLVEECT